LLSDFDNDDGWDLGLLMLLFYELETEFEVIETFGFSFIFSIEIKKSRILFLDFNRLVFGQEKS
jgi:hypothetical protein